MSKYTQEQETEIVKDALFLTKTIELEEQKLATKQMLRIVLNLQKKLNAIWT